MKLKGALLFIVLAALGSAATANAASFRGVVVGKQHGLLLVATPSGLVQAIHGNAAIGSRLQGSAVIGRATRARIHGVVVKRIGSTMFLSSNRHLLAVHMGRGLAANNPSNPGSIAGPTPGSVVNTTVGVNGSGELDEENEDTVGQVSGNIQVQATITAVGNGTVTLTVNGQSVTVNLPAGLTLPASMVGQTVTINVSLGNDQGDEQGDDDNGDNGGGGGDD